MKRVLEPELMVVEDQVKAYAEADFSEAHNRFIDHVRKLLTGDVGTMLDLGCGPGDISRRFSHVFPKYHVIAVDGSEMMLKYARSMLPHELRKRIEFILARLPDDNLPDLTYNTILSNSLLHHLPDAQILWSTMARYGQKGTQIAVMDLLRPASIAEAQTQVNHYAAQEPKVLQKDFYNSLLAAFSLDEINAQLERAHLNLTAKQISDLHVLIYGVL